MRPKFMGDGGVLPLIDARPRRFRLVAAAGLGIVVLQVVWLLFKIGGDWGTMAFSDLIGIPVPAAAAVACWIAARREQGRTRWAWILLGAGVLSWALGETVWSYYELVLGREVPFPGVADIGFLGFIPFVAGAVVCFPSAPSRLTGRTATVLDGLIIASSLVLVAWPTVLSPLLEVGSGSSLATMLWVAYPFGDVLLIGVVIFVAARIVDTPRTPITLIGGGLVSLALADALFTFLTVHDAYASGNLVDAAWTLGFVLIGLGAVRSEATEGSAVVTERVASKLRLIFPYVAVVCAAGLAAYLYSIGRFGTFVLATLIVLGLSVVTRQLLVVLENHGLASDLEHKVAERTAELAGTLAKLEEANRRQDEFVSNATHELRTPLTLMIGSLDTISTEDLVSPDALHLVELGRRGARRMSQLVDDLLLASGLRESIHCYKEPFDVAEQVRSAVDGSPAKDRVIVSVGADVTANGDKDRFAAALGHVLSNAAKFAPDATPIRVNISGSHGATVDVCDSGPGIPVHLRTAVFDRFLQADGSATRRYGGLGLGLFLARQLMKRMDGDAEIIDTDLGCTIRLRLPASAAPADEKPSLDGDGQGGVGLAKRSLDGFGRSA